MRGMKITEARACLAETVDSVRVSKERVVLEKHGRRVAALVPVEDLDVLENLSQAAYGRLIREALEEQGDTPPESFDQVADRLGLPRMSDLRSPRRSTRQRTRR